MDIAEVLRLNNRATIDSLLPLTKVTSKAAIKKYSEMGYSVGMTAEEFSGKYPLLPIKNIFATNDMVSSLYYCELENELPIVIVLQIFGKERLSFGDTDEQFQKHVLERANKLRHADISMIGAYLYSLNGSLLLSVLSTYVKRAKPSEELYDLFVGYYRDVDYGFSNIAISDLKKVASHKSEKAKEETARNLADLPDTIRVYRGEGSSSTPYTKSFSWTTSINVAYFFACRLPSSENSRIISGTVSKKDVIEYFPDDGEKEIWVLPSSVKDVKEETLYGIDSLAFLYPLFASTYQTYRQKIKKLYASNESHEHDAKHTLRVLFNALVIVYFGKIDLTKKDEKRLYDAILYHDIGRTNEDVDDSHGAASADIYERQANNPDSITRFLIQYHCIDDDASMQVLDKMCFHDKDSVTLLYKILKDADALDRVRFGMRAVDVNYFRLPISPKLLPTAQTCLTGLEL